jgi:ParB family chromosome partitioning protein
MRVRCSRWPVRSRFSWPSAWCRKGLSVRETERLVQYALRPGKEVAPPRPDRDLLRLQEELADLLGAQVAIRANQRGAGKVLIEFGDLDQLEGILQRLRR